MDLETKSCVCPTCKRPFNNILDYPMITIKEIQMTKQKNICRAKHGQRINIDDLKEARILSIEKINCTDMATVKEMREIVEELDKELDKSKKKCIRKNNMIFSLRLIDGTKFLSVHSDCTDFYQKNYKKYQNILPNVIKLKNIPINTKKFIDLLNIGTQKIENNDLQELQELQEIYNIFYPEIVTISLLPKDNQKNKYTINLLINESKCMHSVIETVPLVELELIGSF